MLYKIIYNSITTLLFFSSQLLETDKAKFDKCTIFNLYKRVHLSTGNILPACDIEDNVGLD